MKFKTHNDKYINTNLTCLQGFLEDVPYEEMVQIFGEPIDDPFDEKVTCYWDVEFQDGTVATISNIYATQTPKYQEKHWHVGGYRYKALGRVRQAVALHRQVMVAA